MQTHVGGATFGAVGFGLAGVLTQSVAAGPLRALAAWSGLGGAGVVWPGRCRRRPAWLWRNVCLGMEEQLKFLRCFF